jgi:hypothetical protein
LPGHSGNLKGNAIRSEAQRKRVAELRAAIATEFPKPSKFEQALLAQAVEAMERAERTRSANDRVRLGRLALSIIAEVRNGRAARSEAKEAPSLMSFRL